MNDPHQILGLPPSATKEQIKKAYRQLAQKYHPDTGSEANEKRFNEITEAYQAIKNEPIKKENMKEMVPKKPKHNLYKERIDPKRKKEQEAFYRSKFRKAIIKTIALAIFWGLILEFSWAIFNLPHQVGFYLGLIFGSFSGSKRFFDLKTFLSGKYLFWHQWIYKIILIILVFYFLTPIALVFTDYFGYRLIG